MPWFYSGNRRITVGYKSKRNTWSITIFFCREEIRFYKRISTSAKGMYVVGPFRFSITGR